MNYFEILLTFVLATYAIITAKRWRTLDWKKRTFIILSIFLSFLVAFNAIQKIKKDDLIEKITNSYGDIKNRKDVIFPSFHIGGSESSLTNTDGGPFFIANSQDQHLLNLYILKKKLFVNAIIKDDNCKIIAVIDNNEWKIFDKSNYEYNNDETSFEVVSNGDHRVYFQVELKNGVANVLGLFPDESGVSWYFFWNRSEKWGEMYKTDSGKIENHYFYYNKPLFKYPRERYFGIRAD